MGTSGQETQEGVHYEEDNQQGQGTVQETEQEQYVITEGTAEQKEEQEKPIPRSSVHEDRSGFVHGLAVGIGLGSIAAFVMIWIVVFFTPQLPSAITYENLLSIFVYPLIYLLAVGLVALTAGIVREYYSYRGKY
jgi:fructose-specific phosphotransferase system IIC component